MVFFGGVKFMRLWGEVSEWLEEKCAFSLKKKTTEEKMP